MTPSEARRAQLCAEIEQHLLELAENNDKGKLRGLFLRLRQAQGDRERFEAEFQKLAALSEKIAQANAAVRLHDFLKRR